MPVSFFSLNRKVRDASAAQSRKVDDAELPVSEAINHANEDLDLLSTADLLHRINDEDRRAAWAVEREIDVIATAVDAITGRVRAGGTLHYFGAGTSGRLAVLDAAEIEPTFGVVGVIVAHLAGQPAALTKAVEGAEDDRESGSAQAREVGLGSADAAIGISASGSAAWVLGAIDAARAAGTLTIGLTGDARSPLARAVEVPIVLGTGPEVIAGSTRMKAGAAQKMALAMISTAVMVKLGKVHGNLMVDLVATNAKLRARARRIVALLGHAEPQDAAAALESAGGETKTAVVMLRLSCDAAAARERLAKASGSLRRALG
ncbi:MAG TPA: N-acetylmuramic acid 6-phosphate etherase [Candidatus Acidoferrales bacterium]|nr:N-acetylmuramic acid 6-phosphate etherase [Candidatus Acidoferrales bacterium]